MSEKLQRGQAKEWQAPQDESQHPGLDGKSELAEKIDSVTLAEVEATSLERQVSPEDVSSEKTLKEVGDTLGVDMQDRPLVDSAEEMQKQVDKNPGLLTKLGNSKLVRRLVLVAGMATLGTGVAERAVAGQATEQKSEKKDWTPQDMLPFIVEQENQAIKQGMTKEDAKEYRTWMLTTVMYMKGNGYDMAFTQDFLRTDLQKRFELTEEQKHQVAEMQQLTNQRMEEISIKYPDVQDSVLNRFQQRAWDFASSAARKPNGMAIFEAELIRLMNEEFADQMTREREIQKDMTLQGYQQEANQLAERASIEFGDSVTAEEIQAFQQEAWDAGAAVVENGSGKETLHFALARLYQEHFQKQLEAKAEKNRQIFKEFVEEKGYAPMPDVDSLADQWLLDQTGNIFQKDGKLYVVESGESPDLSRSESIAGMAAASEASSLLAEVNGRLKRTDTQSEGVRIQTEVSSEVMTVRNVQEVARRTFRVGNGFRTVMVYEVSAK